MSERRILCAIGGLIVTGVCLLIMDTIREHQIHALESRVAALEAGK